MTNRAKRHPKRWTAVAASTVAAVIGTVALAGTASATTDASGETPPRSREDRTALMCEHLDEIEARMASHLELITGRQSWLATKRAAAVEAGLDAVVERIDRVSARLTERQARVEQRSERLTAWAATHCDAA
ncbi:MAG: hypothetical protein AB7L17_21060 [Ilumatobacteraceae bacterium]|jgi:hypothetical protein